MRLFVAMFISLACGLANAQTVNATLSKSRVYVGDEVVYSVVVADGAAKSLPSIDFPDSVTAGFSGQSQQSTISSEIVNGQRRQVRLNQVVYAFSVRPNRPGLVSIPEAEVTLTDGRTLTTPEVQFEALLPEPSTDFTIDISLPRTQMYVGETVRATVIWTVTQNVDDWTFDTTPIPPGLRVEPSETPPPAPSGRVTEFKWFGRTIYASIEQVFAPGGGSQVQLRFYLFITPTSPGEQTLGPLRVVFDRYTGRNSYTRAYSESDPILLDVRPIPAEGRPSGYNGLIGSYTLRTMATPTTANVGDPITLRAELSGAEPMTGADSLPDLSDDPRFKGAFRVSAEGWSEEQPRERGRRVFVTTLRALSDDVTSIPSITLHTFDPEAGAYSTVLSDPIQLDIRAVREATIADAVLAPGSRSGPTTSAARPTLSPADPGFWAPPTPEQIRSAKPFDVRATLSSAPALVTLSAGPAVLAASALLLAFRRRSHHPHHRRRRALRRAEHLALREGPAAGVRAAVAELLNADPSAIAASDVARLHAHPGVKRTLREAIEPDESGASQPISARDARLAIRTLRRGFVAEPKRGAQ